jgi:hypothetical protein
MVKDAGLRPALISLSARHHEFDANENARQTPDRICRLYVPGPD